MCVCVNVCVCVPPQMCMYLLHCDLPVSYIQYILPASFFYMSAVIMCVFQCCSSSCEFKSIYFYALYVHIRIFTIIFMYSLLYVPAIPKMNYKH